MPSTSIQVPSDTPEITGSRLRLYLIPAMLALGAIVAVTIALWPVRTWYRAHLERAERAEVDEQLSAVTGVLTADLNERLSLVQGLTAFVRAHPNGVISAQGFETFASGLYSPNKGIRVLQLAPDGIVRFNFPVVGNEASMGRNLMSDADPRVKAEVRELQRTRVMLSGRPTPLWQGGFGIVIRQAVYRDDHFWGIVIVVLDSPKIIADAHKGRGDRIDLAIRDDLGRVFFGDKTVFDRSPVLARAQLPGNHWELAAIPKGGWRAPGGSALLMFRLFMWGTIVLFGLITYLIASRQVWLQAAVVSRTRSLREVRERFDAAVRGANDGLWDWDIVNKTVYWSPRFTEQLGYLEHEVEPSWEAWESRVHSDDLPRVLEVIKSHLDKHVPYRVDYRLRYQDGTYRWYQARSQAVWDPVTGKPLRMAGSLTDINDRKLAEQELRTSEAKFRRLAESANAMICVIVNRKIIYANPYASTLTGHAREDLLGRRFVDFVHPDWQEDIEASLATHAAGGPWPGLFETLILRKDGELRWVEVSSSAETFEGALMVTGIAIDITDRKQFADELDDRLRFEAMVADLSAALVNVAAADVDHSVNDALERVGQFLDVDCITMSERCVPGEPREIIFSHVFYGPPLEQCPLNDQYPWAVAKLERGEPFAFSTLDELPPEAVVDRASWERRGTFSCLVVPLSVAGDFRFGMSIATVHRERKWSEHLAKRLRVLGEVLANALIRSRMHSELQTSADMLRSLNTELSRTEDRARRRLAAVLHDDLAQNLYGTTAELVALRNAASLEGMREKLDTVIERLDMSLRQARDLTYDLCPPVLYELGLVPALNQLAERFTERYGIEFSVGRSPKGLWIDSDQSAMLYQAVRELFANVVKHSKAAHAVVTIDEVDEGLILTVADDGIGCQDEAEQIKTSPSGFGLFNMRERLRSLGGQFNLESGPSGGCVVRLTVPAPTQTVSGGKDGHSSSDR